MNRGVCKYCRFSLGGDIGNMYCEIEGLEISLIKKCPLNHKTREDAEKELTKYLKRWRNPNERS